MPNAAEVFIEVANRLDIPKFCAKLLLKTSNPEGFKIYSKPLATTVEYPIDQGYINKCAKIANVYGCARMGDAKALNLLIEIIGDSSVDEEIRMYAAGFLRILLDDGVLHEHESFFRFRTITSERPTLQEEVAHRTIESLIKLLKSDNPSTRAWTVFALGTSKDQCVVKALIRMLLDENSVVRRKASINLGMIGNPLAAEPLIELLLNDDTGVRLFTARSLGQLRDPCAIEPLIKLIKTETNTEVKETAISAIGNIANDKAYKSLSNLFKDNKQDIPTKISIAGVFAKRGNLQAQQFLVGLLNDSNSDIKKRAAGMLTVLNRPEVIGTLIELIKGGWRWGRCLLGELYKKYPNVVLKSLLSAVKTGDITEDCANKVLASGEIWAEIRNPEAYLQYLLKRNDKQFSYTSFLTAEDINRVPECCKSALKIGSEAIAVLNENHEKDSVHALSCPEVKAAYWS